MTPDRVLAVTGIVISIIGFAFTLVILVQSISDTRQGMQDFKLQMKEFEKRIIDLTVETKYLDRRMTDVEKKK